MAILILIRLDALLGEYTEDDDRDKVSANTSKKTHVWMVTSVLFVTGFLKQLPDSMAMYPKSMPNLI